jgi:hypothetical protein
MFPNRINLFLFFQLELNFRDSVILATIQDSTRGLWREAQIMYSFPLQHKVRKSNWSWGRCYDHNFLRFLPIFGEKIGVFLKKQCYDQFFHNLALLSKMPIFFQIFSAKIF